ncbi:MAG: carboxypeptidase regulatory-like domain-containing protein [Planctomycetes bacterium]|nr:carboxypeptidase regulatory-like domain-containing protein [Planctomycetota bacterium]MCB9891132.1 carboxypeptidase regulatory-like domain-containing protein [Planctomycetota bacterium]MCB9918899.1 carboxypeptidase regulatory-like domain-containing protein [Planctomycetota bacterium]
MHHAKKREPGRERLAIALLLAVAATSLTACNRGTGSRVAPYFTDRPRTVLAGSVVDGSSRRIVSATVRLDDAWSTTTDAYGRFEFGDPPAGIRRLTIDAVHATATGAERYGTTTFTRDVPSGANWNEFPVPFVLPDLTNAPSAEVTIGTATPAIVLDARTSGVGPTLRVAAGTFVERSAQTSGDFRIEVATVSARDLPAPLPDVANGVLLSTRVLHVFPEDMTFASTAASLEFTNELSVPVNERVFALRFDEAGMTWQNVGSAISNGTALLPESSFVTRGGRYVFATVVAATTLEGVLRDLAKRNVSDVFVDLHGRAARSDRDGRYSIGPLPAVDATGTPLVLTPRIRGGVPWAPVVYERSVVAALGATAAGTLDLAFEPGGTARYFVALRGEAHGSREVRVGSSAGGGIVDISGPDGFGTVRGLSAGWTNATTAWSDGTNYFRGDAIGEIVPGRAGVDMQILVRREELRQGELRGQFFARVLDARTGAPMRDATVQGNDDPNTQSKGRTNFFGELSLNGERFGVLTASAETTRNDGRAYRSAQSVTKIDNVRVEFPLERFTRIDGPVSRAHGSLEGTIVGTRPSSERRMLVQSRLTENDWFTLALGESVGDGDRLPRSIDPDTTGGDAYRLGVPTGSAAATAVEGRLVSGRFVPERIGSRMLRDVRAGVPILENITLDAGFDRSVVVDHVVSGLDARIPQSAFEYKLGAVIADDEVLDVCPWSSGVEIDGDGVRVFVPDGSPLLANRRMLIALRASTESAGVWREQEAFVPDAAASFPGLLPQPEITAPLPGATTESSSEVTVQWNAMTGVDWFELEIVLVGARAEDRIWRVTLRGDVTEFRFRPLVDTAPVILGPGLEYRLTLRACRLDRGPAFGRSDLYQRIAGNLFTFRGGHRGIGARSTVRQGFRTP